MAEEKKMTKLLWVVAIATGVVIGLLFVFL
jgi:hypothetical protein